MTRRTLFAALLAPYLARFAPRLCPVVEYATNTTPVTGTISAIDRGTYYVSYRWVTGRIAPPEPITFDRFAP